MRNFSAPSAPYAQAGAPREVELAGGNWIRQTVDTSAMTIINVAISGRHVFGGYVQISMMQRNGIQIAHGEVGGNGPNAGENKFRDPKLFAALGLAAYGIITCNAVRTTGTCALL